MKTYKGYELLKAIADGEIKDGSKIKIVGRFTGDLMGSYFIYDEKAFHFSIFKPDGTEYDYDVKLHDVINWKFELIEDEINIQEIEEVDEERYIVTDVLKKINELVQAVKQLDKNLKEFRDERDKI